MRTRSGVLVVLAVAALSLAALPQDPKPGREPIKYGDRLIGWIGKQFDLQDDRAVAIQGAHGQYRLVAVGVDYAEFQSAEMLLMVPLAALRFQVDVPPK